MINKGKIIFYDEDGEVMSELIIGVERKNDFISRDDAKIIANALKDKSEGAIKSFTIMKIE